MHPVATRLFPAALVALLAACGSSHDAAFGPALASGTSAPTSDEMRAAQASTQSASDGSDGATGASHGSSTRADAVPISATADASASLSGKRDACFADAAAKGAALVADATGAQTVLGLVANLKGGLSGSAALSTRAQASLGAAKDAVGGSSTTAASASASVPTIPNTGTLVGTTTLAFDATTCALGNRSLSGSEVVQLSANSNGQKVLQVAADLVWKLSDGATVKVTSSDPNYPTFEVDTDSATATSRAFDLFINEHRVRTAASGTIDIDVDTRTIVGEQAKVTETTATAQSGGATVQSRTIVSGAVQTTHNLAKFVATHTYTNLQFDLSGSCSCPVSGTLEQTAVADDGSRQASHTYTFTGCGTATVASSVTANGSQVTGEGQVQFESCK